MNYITKLGLINDIEKDIAIIEGFRVCAYRRGDAVESNRRLGQIKILKLYLKRIHRGDYDEQPNERR